MTTPIDQHVDERRRRSATGVGGERAARDELPAAARRSAPATSRIDHADDADRQVALGERRAPRRRPRARATRPSPSAMPPMIGPMILSRVQIAATPIAPAPMKRTCCRNTAFDHVVGAVARRRLHRGQHRAPASPQAMSMPTSIAMPTVMPTRWPTPISAIEQAGRDAGRAGADAEVAARPRRRPASSRRAARSRPRRASRRRSRRRPPCILLGALARAGADLQHFGRGDAFGIGQVRSGDERAAQRHREHHAQHAADGADAASVVQ